MTSPLEDCLAILKALQIAEVSYCLNGSGDEGTAELDRVLYAGGEGPFPAVTIGITDAGDTVNLEDRLLDLVYELPEGDWINNEGGHGTVILRPQEADPDCQVECNMTYGEDGEEEADFEDDEDFLDSGDREFPEAEGENPDPANAIAVDDSALQPQKPGDRQ
jgi:hypothetical protein